jgi:superfamily I DNA and/or RNA helicase
MNAKAKQGDFAVSLFQRLMQLGMKPDRLRLSVKRLPAAPMFFFNSSGEEPSSSGTSFINRGEAVLGSQIITKLCLAGKP